VAGWNDLPARALIRGIIYVEPDVVMACCGDVPTLETLAAISILREHLPELKVRVVNVVDLLKLAPADRAQAIHR